VRNIWLLLFIFADSYFRIYFDIYYLLLYLFVVLFIYLFITFISVLVVLKY